MLARSRLYAGLLWTLLLLALIAPWIGLYPVLGMRMMCASRCLPAPSICWRATPG